MTTQVSEAKRILDESIFNFVHQALIDFHHQTGLQPRSICVSIRATQTGTVDSPEEVDYVLQEVSVDFR